MLEHAVMGKPKYDSAALSSPKPPRMVRVTLVGEQTNMF
jgi:hypothetical protein